MLIHDHASSSAARACAIAHPLAGPDRVAYVSPGSPEPGTIVPLLSAGGSGRRAPLVRTLERVARRPERMDWDSALLAAVDALQLGDIAYARPPYRTAGRAVGALLLCGGDALAEPRADGLGVELSRRRVWPVFVVGIGAAARG